MLGISWTVSVEEISQARQLASALNAVVSYDGTKSWSRRRSFRRDEDPDGRMKESIDSQIETYRQRCDEMRRIIDGLSWTKLERLLAYIEFHPELQPGSKPRPIWEKNSGSFREPCVEIESDERLGTKQVRFHRQGGFHFEYALSFTVAVQADGSLKTY